MEVAAGLDVADHRDQRRRIDQLAERHVIQLQLAGDGNHHPVEPLLRSAPIRPHAQLAAQHHVERLRPGATALVTELHPGDLPLLAGLSGVFLADQVGEDAAQVELRDGDVPVVVAGDAFDMLVRQVLGKSLGDHHHAELLALGLLADPHRGHDPFDHFVEVHNAADGGLAGLRIGGFLAGLELAGDVFDADDQAGLAGDGGAVGQPAGAAAHGLGDKVAARRLGVGQQIADLAGQHVHGSEVSEGEVDARVVVVDRLRQVDHGDVLAARRQLFLKELELVGGFQGVVAADGDQGVDAHRLERFVDGL